MISQTYSTKQFELSTSKAKYTPVEPLFKEARIMTLNEIIKSENCLLTLHNINQCLPLNLRNLLLTENDLHNYSTRNSANHQLALPQVKTTNHGLHSTRYKTAKHWNSVQNSLKLNFANSFVSYKKFLKAFKENIHSDNPAIV